VKSTKSPQDPCKCSYYNSSLIFGSSFDLEWPFINYNYKADLDEATMRIMLSGKSKLQDPLFRVYRQLGESK